MAEECSTGKSRQIWRKVASFVHRKTADALQDYPAVKVPNEPALRTTMRLVVTALAIVVMIGTIFFVYHSSQSSRTVRHWGSTYLLTLPTSQLNYPNLLCPCNKSSISWPYFINFYWINQSAGQTNSWNRQPISNYTEFCDPLQYIVIANVSTNAWIQGCYSMAQSMSLSTNDTMWTTISTNSVTAPSVLAHMISVQMQGAIADVFGNYAYLSSSNFADWVQLLNVKQMLDRTAHRLVKATKAMGDKNSTNDCYWRFFKGDKYRSPPNGTRVKAFDLTGERAMVMEMNWAVYVDDQCRPPYCDEVVRNSLLRRFAIAITQVGGFTTVMMVVLHGAVWPFICWINQWN